MVRFENDDDVWSIVDLIVHETMQMNKDEGKDFDVAQSIKSQLPWFACRKAIYSSECQNDVERYIYCKEFGVSPYQGSFEDHPSEWIKKVFIIKSAISKREKEAYAKAKNNG